MSRREIILDTETTGMMAHEGHRLCAVAALEMVGGVLTGRACVQECNPERDVSPEAARVNGYSLEMLKDKPLFRDVARELRDFIADSTVVITCWTMEDGYVLDRAFIDKELALAGVEAVAPEQWLNARRWGEEMYGHKQASLNPMLERFGIDRKGREAQSAHGALLDARLLAELYPLLKKEYAAFSAAKVKGDVPKPR